MTALTRHRKIHNRNKHVTKFFWCHEQFNRKKEGFFLVLQISSLLFQNSCMRNTTSKIGLPSRHNTILRCPKTRLSMREIQFFSDVKWEIDKESFSGLETALQWVSFYAQWVEFISGIALKIELKIRKFQKLIVVSSILTKKLDFVPKICPSI